MSAGDEVVRVTVFVRGNVQGVGFRWWVRARALELGLVGHARNTNDGRVEVVAQGRRVDCAALVAQVMPGASVASGSLFARRPGHVDAVSTALVSAPRGELEGFVER